MPYLWMTTADLQDRSVFDSYTSLYLSISGDWARTGTHSFVLTSVANVTKAVPDSATYYVRTAFNLTSRDLRLSLSESGTAQITVLFISSNGTIEIRRGTNSGTLLGSETVTDILTPGAVAEVYAKIHNSTGQVTIKINGVEVLDVANVDTLNGGTGVINQVVWNSSGNRIYIDDLLIRDDAWPGLGGVYVLTPTGAGDDADWTASAGDAYACVDDLPPSYDDYIHADSASAGLKHLFQMSDLPVVPTTITAAGVVANARLAAAGSGTVRPVLKSGATYSNGTDTALSTTAQWLTHFVTVDPADSGALTITDIDAMQVGVETR